MIFKNSEIVSLEDYYLAKSISENPGKIYTLEEFEKELELNKELKIKEVTKTTVYKYKSVIERLAKK